MHKNDTCDDNNECTIDFCKQEIGCVHIPRNCEDGFFCTDHTCEPGVGCLSFNKTCIPDLPDCQVSHCREEERDCKMERKPGALDPVVCYSMLTELEKGFVTSAGAVAFISIVVALAAVGLFFASKKGYNAYKNSRANMSTAQTNPLYEEKPSNINPLYEDPQ